jgi:hypothetical protein
VAECFERAAELALSGLCPFSLADVPAERHNTRYVPRRIRDRIKVVVESDPPALVFQFDGLPGLRDLIQTRLAGLRDVRGHELAERLADDFRGGGFQACQRGCIGQEDDTVRAEEPDRFLGRVQDTLQGRFTLA